MASLRTDSVGQYLFNPAPFRRAAQLIQQGRTRQSNIFGFGDSWMQNGFGCDTKFDSNWFMQWIAALQGRYGFGGAGFIPFATMAGSEDATAWTNRFSVAIPANCVTWAPNAVAGGGFNGARYEGLGMSIARLRAADAGVTFSFTTERLRSRATRVGIVSINKGGSGTQPWSVTGATTSSGNITFTGVSDNGVRVDWIDLTPGVNVITLGVPVGLDPWLSGMIFDQGVGSTAPSTGVFGLNFGHHGRRLWDSGGSFGLIPTGDTVGLNNNTNVAALGRTGIDLAVLALKQNDITSTSTPTTYEAMYQSKKALADRAVAQNFPVLEILAQRPQVSSGTHLTYDIDREIALRMTAEYPLNWSVWDEGAMLGPLLTADQFDLGHPNQNWHINRSTRLMNLMDYCYGL